MIGDESGPPSMAVEWARRGAAEAQRHQTGVSLAGIEVAEALTGQRLLTGRHVQAMARHLYDPETTNGKLLGGPEGRTWARRALLAAADDEIAAEADAETEDRPDLAEMSRLLNEADRLFREKLEAVLSQAMRTAARRAYKKAAVRIASARRLSEARRAEINKEWRRGRITPAFLAATSTTFDELLDESFDDAADQAKILFDERQQRRRNALLLAFAAAGLTLEDLDRQWSVVETQRADTLFEFIPQALAAEARSRFDAGSALTPPLVGEIPRDIEIPSQVLTDSLRIANGSPVEAGATAVIDAPQVSAEEGANLFDYTDTLISDVVGSLDPGATVTYIWSTGDPQRPFEPHQELAGLSATDDTYFIVFAKDPGEFPEGNDYWLPQDHPGCMCEILEHWGRVD